MHKMTENNETVHTLAGSFLRSPDISYARAHQETIPDHQDFRGGSKDGHDPLSATGKNTHHSSTQKRHNVDRKGGPSGIGGDAELQRT